MDRSFVRRTFLKGLGVAGAFLAVPVVVREIVKPSTGTMYFFIEADGPEWRAEISWSGGFKRSVTFPAPQRDLTPAERQTVVFSIMDKLTRMKT